MSALSSAFEVCVMFSAIDRLTGPMERMAGQMGLLDKRTQELQNKLNNFKNMTFVGGGITLAGMAMLNVIEKGVDEASTFITKMTAIKDITGATADEMERIQKTIRQSSGQTIFGIQDTASFAKKLASSGFSGQQVNDLLPLFTQFAEVQKLGKGSNPDEVIAQAIGAAHATGNYSPEQLAAFLDKYNKATFMQPGSSTEFADTFKYLAPVAKTLGVSDDDALTTAALANRFGLNGSMGGTNSADTILRSIPGLFKNKRAMAGLKELGIANTIFDSQGNFMGLANMIEQLSKGAQGKSKEDLARIFHDVFGAQGMKFAESLANAGPEQLKALQEQMGRMKSISEQQHDFNQTPEGQMLQLQTNIENLKLDVFLKLAEVLNPIFKWLNLIVSKIQEFSAAHPTLSKIAGDAMLLFTAFALVVGPIMTVMGALGYLKAAGMVATGLRLIATAFSMMVGPIGAVTMALLTNPITWIILGIIAVCYVLYKAWTENWGGIRDFVKPIIDGIGNQIDWLCNKIGGLIDKLAGIKRQSQIAQDVNIGDTSQDQLWSADHFGHNAMGTDYWSGGLTWVGERGPELVNLPRGSQVIPNDRAGGGGINLESGAIVIYQQPGQSARELAKEVMREMGILGRNQSYGRGDTVSFAW